MYFGSDNQTGASDQVLQTLIKANQGVTPAYADDEWTAKAVAGIQEMFECDADVFLVSTGTAANSLSLACMTKPFDSVLCHGQAHIINDELTAPEFFTQGARLIGLDTHRAKLSYASVAEHLSYGAAHPPHNSEPKVLSLTQINESGQVYSVDEVTALTTLAHDHGLTVHMDGARFSNAVIAANCTPAELTWKAGVDVLCLGATKNGALCAEAVIFFNKTLSENFIQHRKRGGHLISKSRLLGAQFCGWLENNHWKTLATQANAMATKMMGGIEASEHASLAWPVMANELFVILSKEKISDLRAHGAVFHEWPRNFVPVDVTIEPNKDVVRLVTSFCTQEAEVDQFIKLLG